MNRISMGTALGVLIAATAFYGGGHAIAEQQSSALSNLQVTRVSLDNGLRVVMNQDDTVPTVAISVYYDVGSRNEVKGRSGFAHLFEHMMFQGSANVGKGEHFGLIINRGGSANGTTSNDRTNYFETLPANELALGLWLEADRMRSLAITQENFENQRMTVMEERRQRIDNQPYIPSMLRINELAYGDYWPYAHSTIGDMQDLIDAPLEAVQEFFDTYYAPNNAVLSISGDFNAEEAIELVQKYFGDIPRRETPVFTEPAPPSQSAERVETMYDANATLPAFHFAFHVPPNRTADHYALEILALVLGDGESSRLNQILVKQKEICQDVAVGTDDRRGPDLFSVWAVMASGHAPKEAQDVVVAELASIAKKGVRERELEKAKNRIHAAFVFGLQSNIARSQRLAEYELYWGDANLLKLELDHFLAISLDDIKRVARTYFDQNQRTVLNVLPGVAPASEEK
ncbi:MAG: M16 family metallopeptidase [Polyangiales bacterium]